jgi:hypothetical protein
MPFPCVDCCNPVPEPCSVCTAGETPPNLNLVVTGFTDNYCVNSADFDIDVIIAQEDPAFCEFNETIGSPLGGIAEQGLEVCDSRSTTIKVEVTLTAGTISVLIINQADSAPTTDRNEYLYQKTGLGSKFPCCDEMTGALTIPFVSETAFGTDVGMGHGGASATVTLECYKCEYCTEGTPGEMSVTIGTGTVGGGSAPPDCTDVECDGIAGTYVLPQTSQCSWSKSVDPTGMYVQWADGFGNTRCEDFFGGDRSEAIWANVYVSIYQNKLSVTVSRTWESLHSYPQYKTNSHHWLDTTLDNPHDCTSFSARDVPWDHDYSNTGAGTGCDSSAATATVTSV